MEACISGEYGHGLPDLLQRAAADGSGATYLVDEPQRYGVIEFDRQSRVISIEERPKEPKSNWAAIGLYFYDEHVADLVKTLKPSSSEEYEITDLNNLYMHAGRLKVERIGRGSLGSTPARMNRY
jgi:glucose-1-phosphate thymidylyltransferase